MEDKDKIIISTGHEPEEELETPHFDAEETLLAARPVVPLTDEAIEASQHKARTGFAAQTPARRIPILALVIIAAVSVGLAGGLAIGLYQGRQQQQKTTPAAAQPSSATTTIDTRLQKPAEETDKTQSPSVQTVADVNKTTEPVVVSQSESGQIVVPEEVPETRANPRVSDVPKSERQAAPDRKDDERPATLPLPAATRRKAKEERAADDDGDKKQKSARRRRVFERDRDDDAPRRVERAGQELNRIRDIFEGARP